MSGAHQEGRRDQAGEGLTPHNTFLVQEIVNDLDAVLHLHLSLLRHGQDRTYQFARFHIMKGWNVFTPKLFVIAMETGHGQPP